jgi:predicted SnoaL-like aldol condensation-catalyzing enzyme
LAANDHVGITDLSFAGIFTFDKSERVNDQRSNALKLMKVAVVTLPIMAAAMPAFAERAYSPQELKNKEIVLDFYQKALNDKDFDAASKYLGKYIQHNPMAADGPEGLRGFLEYLKKNYPQSKSEIKRVMVDGDYVILRVHAIRQPGDRGSAIVDIFRVEDNKIQEHWDSVQPIPETSKNSNTMF